MGVIIGSATTVTMEGAIRDGFQSVSWSTQVNTNRLWQIGAWGPYRTQVTKNLTCNVTTYAGVLTPVSLTPATSCDNSTATKTIFVDANACSMPASQSDFNPGEPMYITSYSYSKSDPTSFATETWALQLWVAADNDGALDPHFLPVPAPSYVIQGITEGNYSGDFADISKMGVSLYAGNDPGIPAGYQITGSQGQVSAGFPGLGNVSDITYAIFDGVGGGVLGDAFDDQGKIGTSQATIQHTPLYIGT